MAHSTPGNIDNKGDAYRLSSAVGAFIVELVTDHRVERIYPSWLTTRTELGTQIEKAAPSLHDVMKRSYRGLELEWTRRFLTKSLGLSAGWAAWIAPGLTYAWECRVTGEPFAFPVKMRSDTERGKYPARGGDDIVRNVKWLYRVDVKVPSDTIAAIAKEYAETAGRHTDARSVVQNGIHQARALLEIVARDGLHEK